jgi:hypothetical protein
MKLKLLAGLVLTFAVAPLRAQTVGPIISQVYVRGGKPVRGSFTVTNNGVQKVAVMFQAQSFAVDKDIQTTFRPLDAGIHVTMSSSTSLAAKESRQIDYEVTADHYPVALTIYSAMIVGRRDDGMAVRVLLPHNLYACSKEQKYKAGCRAYIREQIWHLKPGQ